MYLEERQHRILNLLQKKGRLSTTGLAEVLNVSLDTIRRDFDALEAAGLLRRTHGGALPALPVRHRAGTAVTAPESAGLLPAHADGIARAAAGLIAENDTVYIGSSPLNWLMLPHLPECPFTVVTNSLLVADVLRHKEHVELFLIGGRVRQKGSTVDAIAAAFIRQFRLDRAFISGAGFSHGFGLSNADADAARYQQAVCSASREIIVLASGDRVGREAYALVVPAASVHGLITDASANAEELSLLSALGIQVIVADDGALPEPESAMTGWAQALTEWEVARPEAQHAMPERESGRAGRQQAKAGKIQVRAEREQVHAELASMRLEREQARMSRSRNRTDRDREHAERERVRAEREKERAEREKECAERDRQRERERAERDGARPE